MGDFISVQQPNVTATPTQADQISIIAIGLQEFVTEVKRVSQRPGDTFDSTNGPALALDANGNIWLVTHSASTLATARLWQMLQDPKTSGG